MPSIIEDRIVLIFIETFGWNFTRAPLLLKEETFQKTNREKAKCTEYSSGLKPNKNALRGDAVIIIKQIIAQEPKEAK
jgi:hypothetical protein